MFFLSLVVGAGNRYDNAPFKIISILSVICYPHNNCAFKRPSMAVLTYYLIHNFRTELYY